MTPAPHDWFPAGSAEPISRNEACALLDRSLGWAAQEGRPIVLAASGGADSTCLMYLFADWRQRSSAITIATIDHGLRAESAMEAERVAVQARTLGFRHVTRSWTGPKPATGVQAAAREARYCLLATIAAESGEAAVVATAHTADDQAETFLMRLARGSGLEGLAGMEVRSTVPTPAAVGGVLVRPLLAIRKSRLIATLTQRGIVWSDDPSNQNGDFERVRVRAALAQLSQLGVTSAAISRSVQRLDPVRVMLGGETRSHLFGKDGAFATVSSLGWIGFQSRFWHDVAKPIQQRMLGLAIGLAGGQGQFRDLAGLEHLHERLRHAVQHDPDGAGGATLGGAAITLIPAPPGSAHQFPTLLILREEGRCTPSPLPIAPGETRVWDGRFAVTLSAAARQVLDVRPLGRDGLLQAFGTEAPVDRAFLSGKAVANPGDASAVRHPTAALRTLPGLWQADRLIAAPGLGNCFGNLNPALQSVAAAQFLHTKGDEPS